MSELVKAVTGRDELGAQRYLPIPQSAMKALAVDAFMMGADKLGHLSKSGDRAEDSFSVIRMEPDLFPLHTAEFFRWFRQDERGDGDKAEIVRQSCSADGQDVFLRHCETPSCGLGNRGHATRVSQAEGRLHVREICQGDRSVS
jgi:hypothetical protein